MVACVGNVGATRNQGEEKVTYLARAVKDDYSIVLYSVHIQFRVGCYVKSVARNQYLLLSLR